VVHVIRERLQALKQGLWLGLELELVWSWCACVGVDVAVAADGFRLV
jgi:hypothetical protein